MIAQD